MTTLMMNFQRHLICLLCLVYTSLSLGAQSMVPPYQLGTCLSCHGVEGVSLNPLWPNLGGQHQAYLLKQLEDMKTGHTRNVPVMRAMLTPLTQSDLVALSDYYGSQAVSIGVVPKQYLKRGEQLYRGGDLDKHIPACIACHGPGGEGNGQAGFPMLSGQQAAYTIQQLHAFHSSERKNDLNAIMRDISSRMDDADMQAVAYYMQGLYPTDQLDTCCHKR